MRLLSVGVICAVVLSACATVTFPQDPTPVANAQHPLISLEMPSTILLWMPQSLSADLYAYRQAVERHLPLLPLSDDLVRRSVAAQQQFELTIKAQGGVFDAATGRINNAAIQAAIANIIADLERQSPQVTTVVLLNLQRHSIPIQKGVARWHNVQQKVVDTSVSSTRYANAVSIEVTYISADKVILNETFGLDISAAPLTDNKKYLKVLRRLFAAFI